MQAIVTKYLSPTNTRGSRIVAKAYADKVTVSYDHGLDTEDNHTAAARALVAKLGWDADGVAIIGSGSLPDDTGYAFVLGYRA